MIEQKEKVCNRCSSSTNGFYGDARTKDGLRRYCKVCDKAKNRLTYQKNKDIKKQQKQNAEGFVKDITKILKSQPVSIKEVYSPERRMFLIKLKNQTEIKLYF